ncbi:hypothetical protein [Streptomyces sp. NPDC053541]|uniref:hypothetical protein n=1 Tax=Streptomyces sp. NPDC053541 TaxID=3365709 RepID=UPI0037D49584
MGDSPVGGRGRGTEWNTFRDVRPYRRKTDLPPLPTRRVGLAAAAMPCPVGITGNCVYASGGSTTALGDATGILEALDPPEPVQH